MSLSARQTATYFAAFFILGGTMASLGPSLLYIASNTGTAIASLGLLFTLRSGGYLIGSLLSGRLYDHISGHHLLGTAILIGGLNLAFIPQISSFTVIIAVMLLIGLAESTLDVGSNTQIVWVHGARSGPYLNSMFLFAGVGGMLSPFLLSSINPTTGYYIMSFVSLPVALWAFFTPSPPRQVSGRHHGDGRLSLIQSTAFCLLTFILIGGEVGFSGWIYSYAYELGLGTKQAVGMLTSFYWMGITLGRMTAIFTTARFKPGNIVLANLTGLIVSLGLILLDPASRTFLWIGSFGFGFFLAPVFPTTFAYLERKTPITGAAAGVLWASGSFGAMVYPWVMGVQMGHIGPVSIMVTLTVSFIVSLFLFRWVSRG
jgi:fucose permease